MEQRIKESNDISKHRESQKALIPDDFGLDDFDKDTYVTLQNCFDDKNELLKYINDSRESEQYKKMRESLEKRRKELMDICWDSEQFQKWIDNGCNEKDGSNVENLNLTYYGWKTIPNEIFKLKKLNFIDCSHNSLTMLPDNLDELKNLTHFYCNNNEITVLPSNLNKIKKLEGFGCANNLLTSFPENFDISNFVQFTCDGNEIKNPPKFFRNDIVYGINNAKSYDYTNGTDYSLGNAKIIPSQIPGNWNYIELKNWIDNGCNEDDTSNVEHINLKMCDLKVFPNEIGNLKQLKTICCSFNRLTIIPDIIGQFANLTKFNCSGNLLTTLPDAICQLTNLTHLECGSCRLMALPDNIGQLVNLTEIRCGINKITMLPDSIGNLVNLIKFDCSCNESLIQLPDTFCQLTNLENFNCNFNAITKLPDNFEQLVKLKRFECCNNSLTMLPNNFEQLVKLEWFDCKNNQLANFPDNFGQLINLKMLFCENNKLTVLPESMVNLENLIVFSYNDSYSYNDNEFLPFPPDIAKFIDDTRKRHMEWLQSE